MKPKSARASVSTAVPAMPRAAKRGWLLDVAQRLFARHGYHAVGIDSVLAEAGVAKMTLYHHFPSKEALIAAVLERRAAEIASEIEAKVAGARGGAAGRVLAVFDWLDEWFRSPGFHGCLFIKAASEYPEDGDLPRRAAAAFKAACQALIRRAVDELGLTPTRSAVLTRQLALLVEGAIVLAFIERRPDAAAEARSAARVLIDGAGAK